MAIYFERHVEGNSAMLIKASELRRKVLHAVDHGQNGYDIGIEYYDTLCDIMDRSRKLKFDILFVWNNYNSSCWKFEQLHILQLLSNWSYNNAKSHSPKEAKPYYASSIRYELESIRVLKTYSWRDSSLSVLPIMQDRYHLAKACSYTSDYFYNMYDFKASLAPVQKSYQMLELASQLWKKTDATYNYTELAARQAITLKHLADGLTDDQCGERVALMEKALQLHESEELRDAYNLWKQQNDSVYYNIVSTDIMIPCLSLRDSFQTLSNIS